MNKFDVVSGDEVFEALKPLRSRLGSVEGEIAGVVEQLSRLSARLGPQDGETILDDVEAVESQLEELKFLLEDLGATSEYEGE
jgi:hypothetical protein